MTPEQSAVIDAAKKWARFRYDEPAASAQALMTAVEALEAAPAADFPNWTSVPTAHATKEDLASAVDRLRQPPRPHAEYVSKAELNRRIEALRKTAPAIDTHVAQHLADFIAAADKIRTAFPPELDRQFTAAQIDALDSIDAALAGATQ